MYNLMIMIMIMIIITIIMIIIMITIMIIIMMDFSQENAEFAPDFCAFCTKSPEMMLK